MTPPSVAKPKKITVIMLITRPRMPSWTCSWMVVVIDAMVMVWRAPSRKRRPTILRGVLDRRERQQAEPERHRPEPGHPGRAAEVARDRERDAADDGAGSDGRHEPAQPRRVEAEDVTRQGGHHDDVGKAEQAHDRGEEDRRPDDRMAPHVAQALAQSTTHRRLQHGGPRRADAGAR